VKRKNFAEAAQKSGMEQNIYKKNRVIREQIAALICINK